MLPEVAEQGFIAVLDSVYRSGQSYTAFDLPVRLQAPGLSAATLHRLDFVYQPIRDVAGWARGR